MDEIDDMPSTPLISAIDHTPADDNEKNNIRDQVVTPPAMRGGTELERHAGDPDYPGSGTVFGSIFNVANCAIGSGVLAFPYAFKCSGLALGTFIIIFYAGMLGYALHILASASKLSNGPSYQVTLQRVLGGNLGLRCQTLYEITVYIYIFGVGCAFLNVCADQFLPLLDGNTFLASQCPGTDEASTDLLACRWKLVALYAVVVCLPLCMVKNINSFVWTSYFAVVAICYCSSIVIKYGIESLTNESQTGSSKWSMISDQPAYVFKAIPIICFAFNCHLAYVPIFQELKKPIRNVLNMDKVMYGAYAICFTFYWATGAFGYFQFGSDTASDILAGLPSTAYGSNTVLPNGTSVPCDGSANAPGTCCKKWQSFCPWDIAIARVCIAISVTTAYPKLQWVSRTCIDDFLVHHKYVPEGPSAFRFYSETVFFVVVTALVSIVLPQLSDVIGIIGSTFATLQVFIFPALLVHKMYKVDEETGESYADMQIAKMSEAEAKSARKGLHPLSASTAYTISVVYFVMGMIVCIMYYVTGFMYGF